MRRLVERFADSRVGYACGQVRFTGGEGGNQEGLYWRYEMGVREMESRLGGITAGNGGIYAVRREAYVELHPSRGQDIGFPFELTKSGWLAVYEPSAIAEERMAPTVEGEFKRKRRMMWGLWDVMLKWGMLDPRGYSSVYALEIYSHRLLRYLTPWLHIVAFVANAALVGEGELLRVRDVRPGRVPARGGARALRPAPALPDRLLLLHRDRLDRDGPRTTASAPARSRSAGRRSRGRDELRTPRPSRAAACRAPPTSRSPRSALLVLSPVLLIAAAAIKLGSRGPVIYRQTRVGRDGREFEMWKLRTMRRGSDPVGVGTAVVDADPRVTGAGRVLRRFALDELPNLVNVIRGEMAIVGPRATLPAQVALYTPRQRRRLELKPGVTGWAQVKGRTGIPWEQRIELDVWYAEHRSLGLDLKIIASPRASSSAARARPRPTRSRARARTRRCAGRRKRRRLSADGPRDLTPEVRARRRRRGPPLVQLAGGDREPARAPRRVHRGRRRGLGRAGDEGGRPGPQVGRRRRGDRRRGRVHGPLRGGRERGARARRDHGRRPHPRAWVSAARPSG